METQQQLLQIQMVWYIRFGYNANGEIGNGTVQNLVTPWCISKEKINVEKNIFDFEEAGEKEQIKYSTSVEFNLLRKTVPSGKVEFTSADENVATVDRATGEITAVGQGHTTIKIEDKQNDLHASVKVNVNGEGNKTQAKIVRWK